MGNTNKSTLKLTPRNSSNKSQSRQSADEASLVGFDDMNKAQMEDFLNDLGDILADSDHSVSNNKVHPRNNDDTNGSSGSESDGGTSLRVPASELMLRSSTCRKNIPSENIIADISSLFAYEKQLGAGASCSVLQVTHKQSKKRYALKEMDRNNKWNPMLFKKELKVLTRLKHSNIIELHDVYIDDTCFYIATQYYSGGALLERVIKLNHFSERIAANYIQTILSAIRYCHSKHVVHRDIKPGNVVFRTMSSTSDIVIIDFGDSEFVEDHEMYDEFVGTIHYLPPEITRHRHGWELKKGDVWSIGILTYMLLCGVAPFVGSNNSQILSRIKKGKYGWPSNISISPTAKHFIRSLLNLNPSNRYSTKKALQHKWLKQATDHHLGIQLMNNLKDFGQASKLQKLLVNSIVSELSKYDKQVLMRAFEEIDIHGKGYIDLKSIENYVISLGSIFETETECRQRAKEIMHSLDARGVGKVHFQDFAKANVSATISGYSLDFIGASTERGDSGSPPNTKSNSGLSASTNSSRNASGSLMLRKKHSRLTLATTSDNTHLAQLGEHMSHEDFRSLIEKAHDEELNADTLIKMLDPDCSGYIEREAIVNFNSTLHI